MFRNIMNNLATWYEIGENKAALIRGGKFVGKTWAAGETTCEINNFIG